MKKIFIAFTGPKIKQKQIFCIEKNYECWNLDKFVLNEFVSKIKKVIPPVNKNVLQNYENNDGGNLMFGITESGILRY